MMSLTSAQSRAKAEFTFTLRDMVRSIPATELADVLGSELASHLGAEIASTILYRAGDIARR